VTAAAALALGLVLGFFLGRRLGHFLLSTGALLEILEALRPWERCLVCQRHHGPDLGSHFWALRFSAQADAGPRDRWVRSMNLHLLWLGAENYARLEPERWTKEI